jgi:hypothetical protein
MDRWVQDERKAQELKIDTTLSQVISVEPGGLARIAALVEMPNRDSEPARIITIGSVLDDNIRIYDTEGHLLEFDYRKPQVDVHYLKEVPPGGIFRLVAVRSQGTKLPYQLFSQVGKVRTIASANCSPNCLNYFQIVLPKSAIFLNATRQLVTARTVDGRMVLTFRNYTGPSADGWLRVRFLWPDEDKSTLADVPPERRGLEKANTLESLLADGGWGLKSSEAIASKYWKTSLADISDPVMLLRLGFALYDGHRYSDALAVFQRMEKYGEDLTGAAIVWQGHMLDLLGRRSEAIAAYEKAKDKNLDVRHDQYGIVLSRKYVEKRLQTPFVRVENREGMETQRVPEKLSPLPPPQRSCYWASGRSSRATRTRGPSRPTAR